MNSPAYYRDLINRLLSEQDDLDLVDDPRLLQNKKQQTLIKTGRIPAWAAFIDHRHGTIKKPCMIQHGSWTMRSWHIVFNDNFGFLRFHGPFFGFKRDRENFRGEKLSWSTFENSARSELEETFKISIPDLKFIAFNTTVIDAVPMLAARTESDKLDNLLDRSLPAIKMALG